MKPRRLARLVLLVLVPCVVAGVGLTVWLHGGRYIVTENAYVKAHIAQVAPEIDGRVIEVAVRDHDPVKPGAVLLRLDPQPYRMALERAEAELDGARTQVETLRASWRETRSELTEAESRVAYVGRQLARQNELAARGVAPAAKREEAENESVAARDRVNVVRQRLQRVLTALSGDPNLAVEAHPLVREKRATRDRAALDLARTTLTAPIGGTAANVKVQPGEAVKAAAPLFVIVSEVRPWVEANFKESELTTVRPGQRAEVVLDVYPDVTWEAVVDTISPASGAEFAILPPQNASGNWVKVVQRVPVRLHLVPHAGEPPLRAGLTATVRVAAGQERTLGDLLPGTAAAKATGAGDPSRP